MSDEADRLISSALRDHVRVTAPASLHRRLEKRYARGGKARWVIPTFSMLGGAMIAIVAMLLLRPATPTYDVVSEAVGDHLRVVSGRGLGVETNDLHNVKPWFAGRIDFVPPVSFLGNDEFVLKGGDVAIFHGHKAAAFLYGRRLHVISLFVFDAAGVVATEETVQGFHVITWSHEGFGFALVSDINWDDLRALRSLLR